MDSTIYALSTPFGKSGVAIIRITGSRAIDAAQLLKCTTHSRDRTLFRTKLFSPSDGTQLDDCMYVYFRAPNTFTGEDIVELHTHGSIAVINGILEELEKIPFLRKAERGEFTKLAFKNGKMSLSDVEALSELLQAETSMQRRAILAQMSGKLHKTYKRWRTTVVECMYKMEALIDFSSDEVPENELHYVERIILELQNDMQEHYTHSNKCRTIFEGIKVLIIGSPNVGKSSIINLITNEEVAIVSEIPGTTRDIISVSKEINGIKYTFYDTAGFRENSSDTIEKLGMHRAIEYSTSVHIILIVIDATTNIEEQYQQIESKIPLENIEFLQKVLLLYNKSDISTTQECNIDIIKAIKTRIKDHIEVHFIIFSAKTATGLSELINALEKTYIEYDDLTLTSNLRQLDVIKHTLVKIKEYINLPVTYIDIKAHLIREVAKSLELLIGEVDIEEILDNIFHNFCIGK
ncbi:tRNA uridine-5-carboxymethylaminomethyl(34) synthesis GTPase MnmE [Candidatus Fokinia crypta]|uniref:tRNA modification GTPase MnmE n=1 Tax=Candidatus Fokinia crypta TaxID=1920990 RepID=A0ABZ0UPE9_9RICK|nr:tRNA uridine-5-carboxymethylaminomethyl(34) synthesis GTPase MnmE [Candidatus Fokinia cryptica]WPX97537.1 tRNA modification GTPase MnmE [Candidatus Fokinia cryptica]